MANMSGKFTIDIPQVKKCAVAYSGGLDSALALKMLPEAILLGPACRHFGRGRLMAYFLPAQLLHLPYIVGMGAAGALGGYEWKGRRIAR